MKNFSVMEVGGVVILEGILFAVISLLQINGLLGFSLFILGSILGTGLVITLFQAKQQYNLKEIKKALEQFNQGNFTARLLLKGNSSTTKEVGKEYELLKGMLNQWIYQLLKSSVSVDLSSKSLEATAVRTSQGIENLTASLGELRILFEQTSGELNGIAMASEELAEAGNRIAEQSNQAVSTTKEADSIAEAGQHAMEQVYTSIEGIKIHADSAVEVIQELEKITEKIEKMADMITSISKQTTMLALNAAIEAARAGEHGRGFSVVAEEVRNLSNETSTAANQISELILTIRQEVNYAVNSMNAVHHQVDQGVLVTADAQQRFIEIKNSITKTLIMMESVSADALSQSKNTQEIHQHTWEVAQMGQTGTASVQEISGVVEIQFSDALGNIDNMKRLSQVSADLTQVMERFDQELGERMLAVCETLATRHEKQPFTNEELIEICRESGLSEIHLADHKGEIVRSNNPAVLGFVFRDEPGSQTEAFHRILTNQVYKVNQQAAFRDVDGKLFKYTGIPMRGHKGIIQCGLEASKMSEFISP